MSFKMTIDLLKTQLGKNCLKMKTLNTHWNDYKELSKFNSELIKSIQILKNQND